DLPGFEGITISSIVVVLFVIVFAFVLTLFILIVVFVPVLHFVFVAVIFIAARGLKRYRYGPAQKLNLITVHADDCRNDGCAAGGSRGIAQWSNAQYFPGAVIQQEYLYADDCSRRDI